MCTKIMFLQCELPGYGIVEIFLMYWLDFRFHCCTNIFRNLILWVLLYCRMDIDYSPTGREFVTGSYDRTVSSFLPHVVMLTYDSEACHYERKASMLLSEFIVIFQESTTIMVFFFFPFPTF